MRLPPWRKTPRVLVAGVVLLLVVDGLVSLAIHWPQNLPRYVTEHPAHLIFERVAEPGFDEAGRANLADSAWSMAYFARDGSAQGYLYVGTNNNIIGLSLAVVRQEPMDDSAIAPEIRRYRPDRGGQSWQVVLDDLDVVRASDGTVGFRIMEVYRTRSDARTYLYAGTAAVHGAALWRSATGDPGDWQQVFAFDGSSGVGSIRGMVAHSDGLLYFSTMPEGDINPGFGQLWATDGLAFYRVVSEEIHSSGATGIAALASFAGCLYAGTYNPIAGLDVWKLRCAGEYEAPAKRVISGGGGHNYNEVAMTLRAFDDHLYIGTGIPLGVNPTTRRGPHGCSIMRLDRADRLELVVGPASEVPLSEYGPGFGWYLNSYCWYLQVHDGYLYMGTWELSRTLMYLGENRNVVPAALRPLLDYVDVRPDEWGSPVGGDLYRTADGIHWVPLTRDGIGNPDNHGIRTLESTPMGLFIGTENPFSRLEVWRLADPGLTVEDAEIDSNQ